MRAVRLALLCTALAAGMAVPSATAARRGCPMVVDQASDAVLSWDPTVERDMPHLDLRSADLTSDARSITAVVRVTKLAATSPEGPFGSRWELSFRASGSPRFLYLSAVVRAEGEAGTYTASTLDPTTGTRTSLATVKGSYDRARNEVRVIAPLDVFESVSPLVSGTWLEGATAVSGRLSLPAVTSYYPADQTRAGAHRVGSRSCVR
ncbi:MAG TPA: hypothetical protein VNA14_08910 [Mycobacteriales bacterium]|nr:hypothetical protein [Mycobacteriales bacterium]